MWRYSFEKTFSRSQKPTGSVWLERESGGEPVEIAGARNDPVPKRGMRYCDAQIGKID
jgi:hypothetical protein